MKIRVTDPIPPGEYDLQAIAPPEPTPAPTAQASGPPTSGPWLSVRYEVNGPKIPLEGALLEGDVWVELETNGTTGITSVVFTLDGVLYRTENNPPYDFEGGTAGVANPWMTTEIPDAAYAVGATVNLSGLPPVVLTATCTIDNPQVVVPPPPPPPPPVGTPVLGHSNDITRHGITFRFGGAPTTAGVFANGDPWVLPCTVESVSPGWDGSRGGSMVNPVWGYDNSTGYDVIYRHNPALRTPIPHALVPGESLISTWSWRPGEPGCPIVTASYPGVPRPVIRQAAVLTCLAASPSPTAMRPPYAGLSKPKFDAAAIDVSTLPTFPLPAGASSPASIIASTTGVWLDHTGQWKGRYMHPDDNMPDYGRNLASKMGEALCLLCCDIPLPEKLALAINVCQFGIDTWGVMETGGKWGDAGGGLGPGRRAPTIVAGHLLGAQALKDYFIDHPEAILSGESTQVHRDSAGIFWGEWVTSTRANPGSTSYRKCCTANAWVGHVLAIQAMGLTAEWNWSDSFEYQSTYMQETHSQLFHYDWAPNQWIRALWDATAGGTVAP